ncbi:GNAT family N-acetyltransferase [Myxosarcina sp. GI1(2024)]
MYENSNESLKASVTLREITADTVRLITDLKVCEEQQRFVASNAVSLAEALFSEEAWFRAIYYGESPVGFVMLYDEKLRKVPSTNPEAFLWRFMVDAKFQGQGIGKTALELVIAHVRAKGVFTSIKTSYVPEPGSPEGFYLNQGFKHTGKMLDGEVVLERCF